MVVTWWIVAFLCSEGEPRKWLLGTRIDFKVTSIAGGTKYWVKVHDRQKEILNTVVDDQYFV